MTRRERFYNDLLELQYIISRNRQLKQKTGPFILSAYARLCKVFNHKSILYMNASKPTKAAYFNYIGSIELPVEIVEMCPISGEADSAIAFMRTLPEVISELSEIDPEKLRLELKEYGAWEPEDITNHNTNLDRILWLACGNIQDEMFEDEN